MRDGAIVQEGSPEEIVTLPADEYVTEFVQDVSKDEGHPGQGHYAGAERYRS